MMPAILWDKIGGSLRHPGALLALMALALPCYAGTLTFDVIPEGGNISGPPASSIGWGYTLSNTSQDGEWLMTTGISSDAFLHGTPTPFFDFPILDAGTSVTVPFDGTNQTGLYQLVWDNDAPIGFINIGSFVLTAQWFSDDPNNGGVFLADADVPPVSYTAEVTNPVPEPAGCWAVCVGLAGILMAGGWGGRRRAFFSGSKRGGQ